MNDETLIAAIRDAYRDVHLAVPQPVRRPARTPRLALAAALAVLVVVTGVWWLAGRPAPRNAPMPPAQPSPTTVQPGAKPPRPTSSATDDDARCADYARTALPPLRFALTDPAVRLRLYASDTTLVACWLTADTVLADAGGGSPTSVESPAFPPGELSYFSADSGQQLGEYAIGRAPAGTTKVEVGPMPATLEGEWWAVWLPGDQRGPLAEATSVTATTPKGPLRKTIRHG